MTNSVTPPERDPAGLPRFRLPGLKGLIGSATLVWLVLATGSTLVGLLWRNNEAGPGLSGLLDVLGIVYWLVPLLLFNAWRGIKLRISLHQQGGAVTDRGYLAMISVLAGLALLLAFAPLGLLSVYDTGSLAADVDTLNVHFTVSYLILLGAVLAVAGALLIMLSTTVLSACCSWLGDNLGRSCWLVAGCAVNLAVLASLPEKLPLSLSRLMHYAQTELNFINLDPTVSKQLGDLVWSLMAVPAIIFGVLGLLLAGILRQRQPKSLLVKPGYLALLGGVVLPSLIGWFSGLRWITDYSTAQPVNWFSMFETGLAAILILMMLQLLQKPAQFVRSSPLATWGIASLAVPVWLVLSIPRIAAGSVTAASLLPAAAASVVLLGFWISLLYAIALTGPRFRPWLLPAVVVVLLLLLAPLDGQSRNSLALTLLALQQPPFTEMPVSGAWAVLLPLLILLIFMAKGIGKKSKSRYYFCN